MIDYIQVEGLVMVQGDQYEWSANSMLEVKLSDPDSFLKIRETLTRIGIASRADKKLYQSVHILHKQGRYFLVHFKEMFALDGKPANITNDDIDRRNAIANLLQDWSMLELITPIGPSSPNVISRIMIVSHKDKENYQLVSKYQIGSNRA